MSNFDMDKNYRVAPHATWGASRHTINSEQGMGLNDLYRYGGTVTLADSYVDSDNDIRAKIPGRTNPFYVNVDFLSEVNDATPAEAPVSVEDAFTPGNEIEFSVSDMRFGSDDWSIGCKAGNYSDTGFMDSVIKLDRQAGTATFKATVTPRGTIQIPGGGYLDRITLGEAREYFKDIKITKPGTPPRPSVTIEYTAEEADILAALIGRTAGTELFNIYQKLPRENKAHDRDWTVTSDGRQVTRTDS